MTELGRAKMQVALAAAAEAYAEQQYRRLRTLESRVLWECAREDVTEAEQALADLSTKH